MQAGAPFIFETDDDNIPFASFWSARKLTITAPNLASAGWVNVYGYFTDAGIWPRGLPLDAVRSELRPYDSLPLEEAKCPIQQGLANGDPDVDAIYRLLLPLPQDFRLDRRIVLSDGSWCPFNSQNTTWWPEAYPLMYLPAHCSFRMTDIWRSFVAQKIAWANGWSILFHEPTVWQDRNEHNLMRDFSHEVPGYLHNRAICETLDRIDLKRGTGALGTNLILSYEALIEHGWIGAEELGLLHAWLSDLARVRGS